MTRFSRHVNLKRVFEKSKVVTIRPDPPSPLKKGELENKGELELNS